MVVLILPCSTNIRYSSFAIGHTYTCTPSNKLFDISRRLMIHSKYPFPKLTITLKIIQCDNTYFLTLCKNQWESVIPASLVSDVDWMAAGASYLLRVGRYYGAFLLKDIPSLHPKVPGVVSLVRAPRAVTHSSICQSNLAHKGRLAY
jgi:hypothetical protein